MSDRHRRELDESTSPWTGTVVRVDANTRDHPDHGSVYFSEAEADKARFRSISFDFVQFRSMSFDCQIMKTHDLAAIPQTCSFKTGISHMQGLWSESGCTMYYY